MRFLFVAQRDLIMVILCSLASIYPQVRQQQGNQITSGRPDKLDTGLKWKRNPVSIVADKAGGRAAYVVQAAPH